MEKPQAGLSSYTCKRSKRGVVQVLNEGSYVMAEYDEHTGVMKWQRVLLTSQRELVEKWVRERYPVH